MDILIHCFSRITLQELREDKTEYCSISIMLMKTRNTVDSMMAAKSDWAGSVTQRQTSVLQSIELFKSDTEVLNNTWWIQVLHCVFVLYFVQNSLKTCK